VDPAPYTGDLDLAAVRSRGDLAALLREVRIRADHPSLRALEAKTRHGDIPLSKTAVAEMLRGARLARKAVMIAFLQACGVPDGELDLWKRTWERVASLEAAHARIETIQGPRRSARDAENETLAHEEPAGAGAARADLTEISRLREQVQRLSAANEQLRSQQRRAAAEAWPAAMAGGREGRQSIWHFPDGWPITLVSYRLPPDQRPPSADPGNPNYARCADLADLDALIDVHGVVRAHNPASRVIIMAAQDLAQSDVATHLVLIGGLTWEAVTPWFSRIFSMPIEAGDPFDRGAIVVRDPDTGEREFKYTVEGDELIEDVGFFACGKNPSAPRRMLTICGGITSRGVRGAALCCTDWEMRERNEQFLLSRFPDGSTYCVVMRVPIINKGPLVPDLSKEENRLFEWCDTSTRWRGPW
jgi:hypothetical protein